MINSQYLLNFILVVFPQIVCIFTGRDVSIRIDLKSWDKGVVLIRRYDDKKALVWTRA